MNPSSEVDSAVPIVPTIVPPVVASVTWPARFPVDAITLVPR